MENPKNDHAGGLESVFVELPGAIFSSLKLDCCVLESPPMALKKQQLLVHLCRPLVCFRAAVPRQRVSGDPGRVGPDAGRVQESVRGQAQRGASQADGPDSAGRPQRRPHGSDVRVFPR